MTPARLTRLGRVDDGTSDSDWDDEERRRRMSVNLSLIPCEWQGYKLNLLDTPGYMDFVGEVISGVRVADAAVVVIDSVGGVEVGTEQVWHYADAQQLPRMAVVNKMERENADYARIVAQIVAKFGVTAVPIQLPIGVQAEFKGVVDLLAEKAYLGEGTAETAVPAGMAGEVQDARMALIEAAAEGDDSLMEKYFEEGTLSSAEILRGLKARIARGDFVPVLFTSAAMNVGARALMGAMVELLPSPADLAPVEATNPATGSDVELRADAAGPLAALIFKTMADPYVGRMSLFRVYSGTVESDSRLYNSRAGNEERIGQLYTMRGKEQIPVTRVPAGDIAVVTKLSESADGGHLVRSWVAAPACAPGLSQLPLLGGHLPQDQGGRSQDQPHADSHGRAGSDFDLAPGQQHARDYLIGDGRYPHQRGREAHGGGVRTRTRDSDAARPVQGNNHPQGFRPVPP